MNILGLALYALVFGVVLNSLGQKGKHLTEICGTIMEALLKIVMALTW